MPLAPLKLRPYGAILIIIIIIIIYRAGSWSLQALRLENDCGPLVHTFTYSSVFFLENVKYYTRTSNVHLYQVKRSNCRLRYQIPRILRPQIFSLEICGPKVVLFLLCKFSLYRAVQSPISARTLRLQPYQPHG